MNIMQPRTELYNRGRDYLTKGSLGFLTVLLLAGCTERGPSSIPPASSHTKRLTGTEALQDLRTLSVAPWAPATGYDRKQFGSGWAEKNGCDTREAILRRDLTKIILDAKQCTVVTGTLQDPYTSKLIQFEKGPQSSSSVEIDHVISLKDAWLSGAQQMTRAERIKLANDPLELLAVDGSINESKGDDDAAAWLPSNKTYRCTYVAKQILVKQKYELSVTAAEDQAMERVLAGCRTQTLAIPD